LLTIVPAAAVKVADLAPAATVTEAGVVSSALLLDKETVAPPVAAGLFKATVHVLVAPEAMLVGLQAKYERADGPMRFSVAVLETPLSEAVTEAD
jgi:hypothetical protein